MDDIKDRLLRKAYLYGDASAYIAGVEAAITAMSLAQDDARSPADPAEVDEALIVSLTR